MTDDAYEAAALRIVELLLSAPPEQRSTVLDRECGGDGQLRAAVEKLSAHARQYHAQSESLTAGGAASESWPEALLGDGATAGVARLGPYRIVRRLGSGGMGVVFEAEQDHPRRTVALKVLRPEVARSASRRFEYESEILAKLHHPAIAQVFASGTAGEEGRIRWFAMEFIEDAQEIGTYAQAHNLALPDRIALFGQVCDAIHHGHQNGIIHRDLKPSNILVDRLGHPKVIDYGVARAVAADVVSMHTRSGETIGTIHYMSPEQLAGRDDVDSRTDVHALGVVLYELLAGRLPFDLAGKPLVDVVRIVSQVDPVPLPRGEFPSDLARITEKAMARDRSRRYASASELAADLRRFLRHEPVQARPPSEWYRLRKFVQRHVSAVAAVTLVCIASLAGAILTGHERAKVARLSDLRRLQDLRGEAEQLYPPSPPLIGAYQVWLEGARRLMGELDDHLATLETLRRRALPPAAGDADSGRQAQPVAGSWTFSDTDEQWWHDTLAGLVADLQAFAAPGGLIEDVTLRLAFASTVDELSTTGPEAGRHWADAAAAVRTSPLYAGLELEPLTGFLPVGPDPVSGLWEFALLQSGEVPARDPTTGKLAVSEAGALVFVLLPGGSFRMGAQSQSPDSDNYDPQAHDNEGPVSTVSLSPFLLSKYEMTQAQWMRIAGSNPAQQGPGTHFASEVVTLLHPVENVTRSECTELMRKLGLSLPTEAQWEYAARGGTATPWSTGADKESLAGHVNLADSDLKRKLGKPHQVYEEWLDDGHSFHARVGSFAPNPFGLHDVHGNVSEWCRDTFGPYTQPVTPGDGARVVEGRSKGLIRGGNMASLADAVRSANRNDYTPDFRFVLIGLRPSRGLATSDVSR